MDRTAQPYGWLYTEDGIRRQVKIHTTQDDRTVQWSPRFLGDPEPWFDADMAKDNPAAYCGDDGLVTLGIPVTAWSGFDD